MQLSRWYVGRSCKYQAELQKLFTFVWTYLRHRAREIGYSCDPNLRVTSLEFLPWHTMAKYYSTTHSHPFSWDVVASVRMSFKALLTGSHFLVLTFDIRVSATLTYININSAIAFLVSRVFSEGIQTHFPPTFCQRIRYTASSERRVESSTVDGFWLRPIACQPGEKDLSLTWRNSYRLSRRVTSTDTRVLLWHTLETWAWAGKNQELGSFIRSSPYIVHVFFWRTL